MLKKPFYPTSEDLAFIYKTIKEDYKWYGSQSYEDVKIHNWFVNFKDENKKIIFTMPKEEVKSWAEKGFPNPPKLDFNSDAFWQLTFSMEKKIIIKFHERFLKSGFDLMQNFSEYSSDVKKCTANYVVWSLLPTYISYISSSKAKHQPLPENLFKTIDWISDIDKKHACPLVVGLLHYSTKKPDVYDSKKVIDLLVKFTNKQVSIPKSQIKKYEEILEFCEKNNPTYWKEAIQSSSKLSDRINHKNSANYEVEDLIAKHWKLDIHNLSAKNGGFNIKTMKDNFDFLCLAIKKTLNENEDSTLFTFENKSSVIKMNLITTDDDNGRKKISNMQDLVHVVYENCLKNVRINDEDITKMWKNIQLMSSLENQLPKKEKSTTKIKKI